MPADLQLIQAEIARLSQELTALENNPTRTATIERQITVARGRLIRNLLLADRHPQNTNSNSQLIETELFLHRNQIQNRLRANRPVVNRSLLEETGLKMQRTAVDSARVTTAIEQRDPRAAAIGLAHTTGDVISTGWSMLKAPLTLSLRTVNVTAPYVGYMMGVMVQPISYMMHQLIFAPTKDSKTGKVDHPYNGQAVIRTGENIGRIIAQTAAVLENGVRRI